MGEDLFMLNILQTPLNFKASELLNAFAFPCCPITLLLSHCCKQNLMGVLVVFIRLEVAPPEAQ